MDTLAMMQVSLGVEPPPAPYDDLPKREAFAGTPSYVSASVRDRVFVAKKTRALYHKLHDHPKDFPFANQ
jgi:hypothetical protein